MLEILNALVSPALATAVAYIAYQQWKTNDRREKREARATKIAIYKSVKKHLNYIDVLRSIDKSLHDDFQQAAAEAEFIFPEEITECLDKIDVYSLQWLSNKECQDSATDQSNRETLINLEKEMEKYIDDLQNIHCNIFVIFKKYID
ncbi:hypothetical protein [Pseudoalteromonas tunicata]|uniref:Uncharacterized protein n=1 Tax=Pseudoalteromonas tunicata D2 TaxID=87626 RepID=A4CB35_9GAMM|nr:hypothetical protein [Pseudoalteromonas tunicata]ATC95134.1 hypothetical protein PTUN_a2687 [Pseudoalteromonas tunicata]AXT30759.1 hypothetical protein D1819_07980 [Pseudoalteromonas tunicata]EAR28593.1 hypothetical protein PTD2_22297 [Pseudoalteromonas tunicata D2]